MDSSSEGAVYNFYLVEVYYTTLRVTRVNEKEDKLFLSLYSEKSFYQSCQVTHSKWLKHDAVISKKR